MKLPAGVVRQLFRAVQMPDGSSSSGSLQHPNNFELPPGAAWQDGRGLLHIGVAAHDR